jgi:uncharacterized damage-inducible protein DinB
MSAYETSTPETHDAESSLWTRARVISALASARAGLLEAIAGLTPREAEKPMAMGKWNARETLLHIVARDRARLAEMDAAAQGTPASWRDHSTADSARHNAEEIAPLRGHSWDQALQMLDATRRELQERLATIPEEPVERWQPSHPFGWMMEALYLHDRHHAEMIRRWRAATGI